MQHEHDTVPQRQFVPEVEQVTTLLGVRITIRSGVTQLVGPAHADQVAGYEPAPQPLAVGHDVAPEV